MVQREIYESTSVFHRVASKKKETGYDLPAANVISLPR
jgi:hypothetical protein